MVVKGDENDVGDMDASERLDGMRARDVMQMARAQLMKELPELIKPIIADALKAANPTPAYPQASSPMTPPQPRPQVRPQNPVQGRMAQPTTGQLDDGSTYVVIPAGYDNREVLCRMMGIDPETVLGGQGQGQGGNDADEQATMQQLVESYAGDFMKYAKMNPMDAEKVAQFIVGKIAEGKTEADIFKVYAPHYPVIESVRKGRLIDQAKEAGLTLQEQVDAAADTGAQIPAGIPAGTAPGVTPVAKKKPDGASGGASTTPNHPPTKVTDTAPDTQKVVDAEIARMDGKSNKT
jgi:hypothetical protein